MATEAPVVAYVGGWATHRHVGDDAILRAHLEGLAAAVPHARPVVLGADPAVLSARFGVEARPDFSEHMVAPPPPGVALDRRLFLRRLADVVAAAEGTGPGLGGAAAEALEAISGCRVLVDLGAGSLTSAYLDVLWRQGAAVCAAAARGIPIIVSGATLGPIDGELDAILLGRMLRSACLVTVRDRSTSAGLARRLGCPDVVEGPDDAGALAPRADGAAPPREPFALLSASATAAPWLAPAVAALHSEHGVRTLAVAMDFVPSGPDLSALGRLRDSLPDPAALEILDPVPEDGALRVLAERARLALGSRYHLAVFAAAGGTPAVLLHHDAYTRAKALGIASLAPGVTPVAATDGPAALTSAVSAALAAPRPQRVGWDEPPPAVARIADLVRG